jgi:hypothetical protein
MFNAFADARLCPTAEPMMYLAEAHDSFRVRSNCCKPMLAAFHAVIDVFVFNL